ncbi:hypothetical protein RFI_22907, partial [Reticulomyxa filosa]
EMIISLANLFGRYCSELRKNLYLYIIKCNKANEFQQGCIALLWYQLMVKVEVEYYKQQFERLHGFTFDPDVIIDPKDSRQLRNGTLHLRQFCKDDQQLPRDIFEQQTAEFADLEAWLKTFQPGSHPNEELIENPTEIEKHILHHLFGMEKKLECQDRFELKIVMLEILCIHPSGRFAYAHKVIEKYHMDWQLFGKVWFKHHKRLTIGHLLNKTEPFSKRLALSEICNGF